MLALLLLSYSICQIFLSLEPVFAHSTDFAHRLFLSFTARVLHPRIEAFGTQAIRHLRRLPERSKADSCLSACTQLAGRRYPVDSIPLREKSGLLHEIFLQYDQSHRPLTSGSIISEYSIACAASAVIVASNERVFVTEISSI
jgi:hypothetical protein